MRSDDVPMHVFEGQRQIHQRGQTVLQEADELIGVGCDEARNAELDSGGDVLVECGHRCASFPSSHRRSAVGVSDPPMPQRYGG